MTKNKGYDRSVVKQLDAANWPAIMPELLRYARAKEKLLIVVGSDLVYIDVAKEAVAMVYGQGRNGKYRNWDPEKYPDLARFLKYVIKDIVRREVARLTGYSFEQLSWENEPGEERELSVAHHDGADAHHLKNQEASVIDKDLAAGLLKVLDDISKEDPDLESYLLCLMDGKTKRRDIAAETGFDINKVYNLTKQLQRRLDPFKEAYGIRKPSERTAR